MFHRHMFLISSNSSLFREWTRIEVMCSRSCEKRGRRREREETSENRGEVHVRARGRVTGTHVDEELWRTKEEQDEDEEQEEKQKKNNAPACMSTYRRYPTTLCSFVFGSVRSIAWVFPTHQNEKSSKWLWKRGEEERGKGRKEKRVDGESARKHRTNSE